MNIKDIKVNMWGTTVGYLHQQENGLIAFQYDKDFLGSGIEVSPIKMPLSLKTYSFPSLAENTYSGLPGMIADSLPDKFGNIVIKRYLKNQGRADDSLSVLEKLCYTGKRGMGALEYEPSQGIFEISENIDISALTKLASEVLRERKEVNTKYNDNMIAQLMQGSSSVGGARAKTLIAWNQKTNSVRSGQINAGDGYEYWLLKFDGISDNKDKDSVSDDKEYSKIEYAYYLMAKEAGINMSECRLYKENGRTHFMTKRFDRVGDNGEKLHMQSLCAMAHMDFNTPRVYSYDEAFSVMRKLRLPYNEKVQLYRRMLFNEYAKNFDDHTKNISFIMDKKGRWSLSPAYDLTYSYKKDSIWVRAHQMLIDDKADDITVDNLLNVAKNADIKRSDALLQIERVKAAISKWYNFAEESELSFKKAEAIGRQILL